MPFEIQQTRWDKLLRRVSGSIGPGSRVGVSISDLFPVLDVERVPSELLILSGTRLAWQSTSRPAVVAQTSASQLQNPVGSGSIITVTGIYISVNAVSTLQSIITETFIGTPVPGVFRDGRLGIARETTGKVASADNVATGGGFRGSFSQNLSHPLTDQNDIVTLGPGQALQVGSTVTNIILTVNYFWRERVAEESELNL